MTSTDYETIQTEQAADPVAMVHSEGTMGSYPSQAVFLGYLAVALFALMVVFAGTMAFAAFNAG